MTIHKILLTGGSGDLGYLLSKSLSAQNKKIINLDLMPPQKLGYGDFIEGSILDRKMLEKAVKNCDCVVHIAAWHGIHEQPDGARDAYDFHDLNVTGTFNVFEACARAHIKKFILISSTSIDDRYGIYGHTKNLNEEMARAYAIRHDMDIIILRPRAFIPPWNKVIYANFIEWAKWFWKGAVHISDVTQATLDALTHLETQNVNFPPPALIIDGAYDYRPEDLDNWDKEGPGSSFCHYYKAYLKLAQKHKFDLSRKPKIIGSTDAQRLIGYTPRYSLKNLLEELCQFGEKGPPSPF